MVNLARRSLPLVMSAWAAISVYRPFGGNIVESVTGNRFKSVNSEEYHFNGYYNRIYYPAGNTYQTKEPFEGKYWEKAVLELEYFAGKQAWTVRGFLSENSSIIRFTSFSQVADPVDAIDWIYHNLTNEDVKISNFAPTFRIENYCVTTAPNAHFDYLTIGGVIQSAEIVEEVELFNEYEVIDVVNTCNGILIIVLTLLFFIWMGCIICYSLFRTYRRMGGKKAPAQPVKNSSTKKAELVSVSK